MTSKNEIRNQQKLQQNMCMGGKKRIREKKTESNALGDREEKQRRKKWDGIKYMDYPLY